MWVGLIALAGVAAETSAVMLTYLNGACARRRAAGTLKTLSDLLEAVQEGALERIRAPRDGVDERRQRIELARQRSEATSISDFLSSEALPTVDEGDAKRPLLSRDSESCVWLLR